MTDKVAEIAATLTPLQQRAFLDMCRRGSTRTNEGGMVDDLLSGLCSNTFEGINNGWLVKWSMNPNSRRDGYINLYTPTELGLAVCNYITQTAMSLNDLADRVEKLTTGHNATDVLVEVALFKPNSVYSAARRNNAGTKVIYTDRAGNDVTCRAMDWTCDDRRQATAAALRALAAMEGDHG